MSSPMPCALARHHADDLERLIADPDDLPDRIRVLAEQLRR